MKSVGKSERSLVGSKGVLGVWKGPWSLGVLENGITDVLTRKSQDVVSFSLWPDQPLRFVCDLYAGMVC